MKPLHNPKAGKTRDRKLGVVVVLIIAAGSALGALAISQDDASNSVSGHKMQTASRTDSRSETPPLVRPLSELDPSEQLTRAYVALFDTSRTEDVKSGDYSYSGGKLLQMTVDPARAGQSSGGLSGQSGGARYILSCRERGQICG